LQKKEIHPVDAALFVTYNKVRTFVGDGDLERSFLGMGIGVSGGALTGRVVYSYAAACGLTSRSMLDADKSRADSSS